MINVYIYYCFNFGCAFFQLEILSVSCIRIELSATDNFSQKSNCSIKNVTTMSRLDNVNHYHYHYLYHMCPPQKIHNSYSTLQSFLFTRISRKTMLHTHHVFIIPVCAGPGLMTLPHNIQPPSMLLYPYKWFWLAFNTTIRYFMLSVFKWFCFYVFGFANARFWIWQIKMSF